MSDNFNKKGQIAESSTWIIATLVILFILGGFIYTSSILAQKMKVVDVERKLGGGNFFEDVSLGESVYSYFLENSSERKNKIYSKYENNEIFRKKFSKIIGGLKN